MKFIHWQKLGPVRIWSLLTCPTPMITGLQTSEGNRRVRWPVFVIRIKVHKM